MASNLARGGTLQVSLFGGFTRTAGQSFGILNWGSLSGTFSTLALPTLSGLAWDTSQLYTTGELSVASAGILGDYNINGIVDAADFIVGPKNQGTSNVLPNDPTGGTIGTPQYNTWRTHFGKNASSGSGAIANAAVPEPASLVLLVLALFGCCIRRHCPA